MFSNELKYKSNIYGSRTEIMLEVFDYFSIIYSLMFSGLQQEYSFGEIVSFTKGKQSQDFSHLKREEYPCKSRMNYLALGIP